MKTELIEYHRKEAKRAARFLGAVGPAARHQPELREQVTFHERAVAWLESLKTIEEMMKGPIFADEPGALTQKPPAA